MEFEFINKNKEEINNIKDEFKGLTSLNFPHQQLIVEIYLQFNSKKYNNLNRFVGKIIIKIADYSF